MSIPRRLVTYLASWLDVGRVTVHAAIAASLVWLIFAFNMSRPGFLDRLGNLKGTDFLSFYAAGIFARGHRIPEMYDVTQFAATTAHAVPGVQGWHYVQVYPPQVALMFWPLAYAPYLSAFAIWCVANVLLYGGCLAVISFLCPRIGARKASLILAALAFPPFFNAIGHGQVSVVALACVVASFYAFELDHRFIAGLALGSTAFKPPIFVAFLITCIVVRELGIVTGMTVGATAQLALVLLLAGLRSVHAYIESSIKLLRVEKLVLEVKPFQMHSLQSFWMLLGVGRFEIELWFISSLAVLVILARYWRAESAHDMRFAALILAAMLIDPHLYIYDAVITAPALVVAIERARILGQTTVADTIRIALYVLFVCFFIGPLSRITHVQLSVLVTAALFFAMTRTGAGETM